MSPPEAAAPRRARTPPRIPKDPPPELAESPRIARLAVELDRDPEGTLERFWAEVDAAGAPLIEPAREPGRRIVTFLWRDRHGVGPGTRSVVLMANKLTDPSAWEQSALQRLAGSDAWHRSYLLPDDWRGSYRLAADDGEVPPPAATVSGPSGRWGALAPLAVADPLNPRRLAAARPGEEPFAVAELPAAPAQRWLRSRPGTPAGTLTEHRLASTVLANERSVWVYAPPDPPPGELPLLVVLDGEDWTQRLALPSTLDNLIADRQVPPLAAVLVSAVDLDTRWRELGGEPRFLAFLGDELLPWLGRHLPITARPERTVLTGRSLGGLTALYAGLRAGDRFGAVLAQSASLWHPVEEEHELVDLYAAAPRPLKLYLEVGRDEWVLLEPQRRLRDLLLANGHQLTYREYSGGHDPACWRGGIADGLIALLKPLQEGVRG